MTTFVLAVAADHLLTCGDRGEDVEESCVVDQLCINDRTESGSLHQALRRALLIPQPDRREDARLLVDLGIMEAAAGEETALAHLEKALALIDEAGERDRAMYALGQTLFRYGRAAEARTVFRRGADASAGDPDTTLRFEAGFMASAAYLVGRAHEAHERVAALTAGFLDSEQLSASERLLVLHLAVFRAMSVPGSGEHAKLALRALGDGVQLWRATSDGMTMSHVILALTWCGFGQEASGLGERLLVEARSRGDSLIFAEVSLARALAMYSLGRVGDAMVDAQAAIVGMRRGWNSTVPAPHGVLAYCLIDRDEIEEAAEVLDDAEKRLRDGETRTLNVWFYMARGRLRLTRGEHQGALDDFLLVGSLLSANTFLNPGFMLLPWRSHAGLAAHALGRVADAIELIDRDIELSREFIPNENIFMDGETDFAAMLVERFTTYHRRSYVCKSGVGDVLIGAAAQVAEYNGVEGASHIKDKLAEMTHLNETIYGTGIAASYQCKPTRSGAWISDDMLANVCKHHVTKMPFELGRLAQDLAGGLVATMPSEADLNHDEIGPLLRKYLAGRADAPVENRLRILRLIENMTLGRNAVGYLTESLHGAGSPQAQRVQIARRMQRSTRSASPASCPASPMRRTPMTSWKNSEATSPRSSGFRRLAPRKENGPSEMPRFNASSSGIAYCQRFPAEHRALTTLRADRMINTSGFCSRRHRPYPNGTGYESGPGSPAGTACRLPANHLPVSRASQGGSPSGTPVAGRRGHPSQS